MKLWAIAMVRDEADVIEAFVRHTLALTDGLAVLDHCSADGTSEILRGLAAEGLPLEVRRSNEPALFKSRFMSGLARECFKATQADFMFALDADEFIRAGSREAIERALSCVPPASHALHLWRSYVPTSFADGFGPHCLRMRVGEESLPRAKVILRRSFHANAHEMLSEGNHWSIDMQRRFRVAHHVLDPGVCCLAHCPVRSAAQMAAKARTGWRARLAACEGRVEPSMSYHWREVCEDLENGMPLTEERLRQISMNYTVPRANWRPVDRVPLVEDPVELRGQRVRLSS